MNNKLETGRLKENLESRIKARYPYLWIVTTEEFRVLKMIKEIANSVNRKAYVFDEVQHWKNINDWIFDRLGTDSEEEESLPEMLKASHYLEVFDEDIKKVAEKGKNFLLIFPDFHFYINENGTINRVLVRILKWLQPKIKRSKCSLIFISISADIPHEIGDMIDLEVVKPPDTLEIENVLNRILMDPKISSRVKINEEIKSQIINSAMGLSLNQAERLFNLAIVKEYNNPEKMVDIVIKGKKGIISASGALEFFAPNEVPDHLAGVQKLKEWLARRKEAFSEAARVYRLPKPRGVFLMGIPGTGKSLTSKFIAGRWHMPLLRMDIGALFSSYVGATEQSLRQALNLVEACAPVILWIDEIEKAFVSGSGNLDAGVSNRVFGTFLTWMQENTKPVFVVATANNVEFIPPELLRKGRFDEIFFLDLPTAEERAAIFEVHIQKIGRNPDDFDIEALVEHSEKFVGAEIEQSIKEAMYMAYADNKRELNTADILNALKSTKPLAETKKEEIEQLRQKVKKREAVLASKLSKKERETFETGLEF